MPIAKFKLKDGKKWVGKIRYNFETISVKGKKKKQLRFDLLYLEPEYRHKGLGTKIMNYVIDKAKKLGCKCVVVELTKEGYDYYSPYEERRKFCEKFGFKFDKEGRYGRLELDKEIEPLRFKIEKKIVEIRSLEQLLDVLIKISQSKVNEVIKSNVSKTSNTIADWVEKTYPDMIVLHKEFRDIKDYTPQQIREQIVRSLRKKVKK